MNDTLFNPAIKEMGEIKGLGKVTLREATIGDLWPYMGAMGNNGTEFPLRVLASSLLIDGEPVGYEQLLQLGVRHLRALQNMLPDVMAINGMTEGGGASDEDDEEVENPPKDAAASVPATGS